MDSAKHKAAVDALNELILSELQSEGRDRFGSVQRLSVIAQKLLMANTSDLRPEHVHMPRGEFFEMGDAVMANPYPPLIGAGNDQAQMVREMLAAFNPAMESQKEQNVAREREAVARELNQLLSAREKMDPAGADLVTGRINEILNDMKYGKEDEDGLSLVPALDVRRREIGTRIGEHHEAGTERPLADGERGGPLALPAGHRAQHDPESVGDGGEHLGDRSRLHVVAERRPVGVDLDRPKFPPENPEAAPQANLSGDVHERTYRAGD